MDTEINWDAPIEAINKDGRVYAATYSGVDSDGDHLVDFANDKNWYVSPQGVVTCTDWSIRNVVPTLTPDERAVAPELACRMKNAILRHVACKPYLFDDDEGPNISVEAEFRSIAAALEPVDPEVQLIAEAMARVDLQDWSDVPEGKAKYDSDGLFREDYLSYARAIRRCQLEKEGK